MNAHGEQQTFFNWDTDNNEPNNLGNVNEPVWGEQHVEMLLSAWPAENTRNGKWNDFASLPSTQQNRIAYGKNNLVVCTYVVPPVHANPEPEPEIPEGYTEHETAWGTVYTKIHDDFYTMEEGQALCAGDATKDLTPTMPIPMNIEQNDFFFNLVGLKTDRDLWLGINDKETEGTWMNDLGDQQFFFNWRNNEPGNNKGRDEDNVEMILSGDDSANGGPFNGLWNDKYNNPISRYNQNNNNMVVCTFVLPGSEPESECGYGWEAHDTFDGRKCLQVNKGEYKIQTAIDMCASQDAQLVQPKDESDNKLYADLIGYNNYDLWIAGFCTKSGKT